MRELILAAEKTKLPIMRIIDQYMGFYTPLVLVIGALVWAFTQDLNRVISVSGRRKVRHEKKTSLLVDAFGIIRQKEDLFHAWRVRDAASS